MKKTLIIAVGLFLVGSLAYTQVVPQPGPPTPMACAYNSSPATLQSGQAGWVQCDNAGQVKTTGSGGGGGAVTVADGADVTQGAVADAAYASGSGTVVAILKGIYASVTGAIPAGTAIIGKVGIDQTTDGTTNAVHLVAGTAIAGKVGIDQTTPGTTNLVALAANQSTNVAQINGVTPLMGNGATGTGSPRVTISNDNTIPTGWPTSAKQDSMLTQLGFGATAIAATSGNVAAATATATLAGTSAKTTYITGFQVTGSGATVAAVVSCTVTNIVGSITLTYTYVAVAGALLANVPLIVTFPTPVPASATNTSIVVSCPSLGAGNTNMAVNAQGFQQ